MNKVVKFNHPQFSTPDFKEQYEITGFLGEGGFGAVYQATQKRTGQEVAVKVMSARSGADDVARERFRREMQLCARLNHPHIVRLIDSGHGDEDEMYTVFEYVPGQSLADLLAAEKRLMPNEARSLMLQVLDALDCAHSEGVLHRDLKPENIMLIQTRLGLHTKLLDFGVSTLIGDAAAEQARLTATQGFVGTFAYTAPENLHGEELTAASDIYAWGLILLECLAGEPAVSGNKIAQIVFEQMSDKPVKIPDLFRDHPLGKLLARVLDKEPSSRLSDIAQITDELMDIELEDLEAKWPEQSEAQIQRAKNSKLKRSTMVGNRTQAKTAVRDASPTPPRKPQKSRELLTAQSDLAKLRQQMALENRRRSLLHDLALRQRSTQSTNSEDALKGALQDITQTAVQVLDTERASIWLYSSRLRQIELLDLCLRSTLEHAEGTVLGADDFPSYFAVLETERAISAHDVYSHEATLELVDYCSSLGIASMLDAPVWVGGKMLGVLCHEHVGTSRTWTEEEVAHAGTLADMASLALSAHGGDLIKSVLSTQEHSDLFVHPEEC